MWRIVKKVLAWIVGVVLSLILISTLLVYIFEDDIKQYAVERLNENLNTRVDVEEIELSFWKRFPYASLTFKNVLIKDAFQYNKGIDTLFFAENIYFDFSLYDLWNEDYRVKKIEAENGVFNMRVNEKGAVNYNILKQTEEKSEGKFEFELESVYLENFRYTLQNEQTGQDYAVRLKEGEMSGNFLEEKYTLTTRVEADVTHIKSGQIPILFDQTFRGKVDIDINNIDSTYTIHAGEIYLSEIPLYFNGVFTKSQFDIELRGEGLNLAEVTNKMQGQYNTDYTMYEGGGKVDFDLKVTKNDSTDNKIVIASGFGIEKGNLIDPSSGLSMKDIQLKGHYHSQQDGVQELELNNMHFETLKGGFDGMLRIEDFKYPTITAKMKGSLDLATIHKFFKIQSIDNVNGTIAANVDAKLKFKNIKNRPDQFVMIYAKGAFDLIETNLQMAEDSRVWKNIDGKFVLSGNDAAMKNVNVQLGSSDLTLNGALQNFVPFLQNVGKLHITSSLKSNNIKIEDFYNKRTSITASSKTVKKLLPDNVTLDFTGSINRLTFEHHPYEKVYGHAVLDQHKLVLNDMRFSNAGGKYSGKVVVNDQPIDYANVAVYLNVTRVDIKKLFEEWNNFDQEVVLAQNIQGQLNSNIQLTVPIKRTGDVIYDRLNGSVGIEIKNGKLYHLPMMQSTAAYLAENKITRLALGKHLNTIQQKLEKLEFQTLSNTIQIKNQKLIMPEMTIVSNLMDINLSAEHWFNNDIDYHFDFRFRDLKIQESSSEFGNIEDDGTGIRLFFRMYGNTSNPQFSFDKDKRKEARKEKFEAEKQTVKSILKEEFNLYKNDSTVSGIDDEPEEKKVEFEFSGEGFEEENHNGGNEEKPKKDNKKKTNKFFQKLENQQKQEEEKENKIKIDL